MGLIQRAVESQGMATVSVTLSPDITRKVLPPRALYPGFPMGHPLSYPGQSFRQLQIIRILLKLLETIDKPGTLVDMDLTGKNDEHGVCIACGEVEEKKNERSESFNRSHL